MGRGSGKKINDVAVIPSGSERIRGEREWFERTQKGIQSWNSKPWKAETGEWWVQGQPNYIVRHCLRDKRRIIVVHVTETRNTF